MYPITLLVTLYLTTFIIPIASYFMLLVILVDIGLAIKEGKSLISRMLAHYVAPFQVLYGFIISKPD